MLAGDVPPGVLGKMRAKSVSVEMCTVVSSRRAVARPSGNVPYQPTVGATGSVRCNFRNADAVGIRGASSALAEDRGRSEAKRVKEAIIL